MLFNLHSHLPVSRAYLGIIDISDKYEKSLTEGIFSAGLHPWNAEKVFVQEEINALAEVLRRKTIVAVGECGLDRVCNANFQLQKECFIAQIKMANLNQKPLIIHCVKAFEEILKILKDQRCQVPVIFHGYRKGLILAKQLQKKGYYLSFGFNIFDDKVAEVFKSLPLDQIFLETDKADVCISTIYERAILLRDIPINEFQNKILSNVKEVFSPQILLRN